MTATNIRVLGTDVSKWQDSNYTPGKKIDFDKMKSQGVKFVFIKACQNLTKDEDFDDYWKASKDSGLMRGAYSFYEYRPAFQKSPKDQADFFLDVMSGDFGELGLALDYEKPNSTWPPLPAVNVSLSNIFTFMYTVEQQTKEDTIFYSNLDFIKNYLGYNKIPLWLAQKPLWLAMYPFAIFDFFPPLNFLLPNFPWKIKFWQFTDRLNGNKYGAESSQIDGNFWLGTEEELNSFRNRDSIVYLPVITNPPEEEEVKKIKVVANSLRIRTSPAVNSSNFTGKYLYLGDEPENLEETTDGINTWVRIGWKQWAAKKYGGITYMIDV